RRLLQDKRQLVPGDGAVHADVVGRQAADGGKGVLAPGPEGEAFVLRSADAGVDGALALGDLVDAADQVVDLHLRAVQLDDQQGLHVERVSGVNELLRRVDGGL